jgi:GT2 family glycosyltransferase
MTSIDTTASATPVSGQSQREPKRIFDSLQVQCVIYELPFDRARRAAEYLNCAARHAVDAGLIRRIELAYGDCSAERTIGADELDRLRAHNPHLSVISATFFGKNLGSAAGHNRLLAPSRSDLTLILNPDVLVAPNLLVELIKGIRRSNMGLVEGRQLPSEHPKDFDPETGRTSWCSTACLLGQTALIKSIGGFDAETFFLYCDDVDLSWRVRLAGYEIAYQPTAVCFHDKRISDQADWIAAAAERYYSAEAGLLLPYKYSRPDLTKGYLGHFAHSGDPELQKAAAAFEERNRAGKLPAPLDPDHKVGQFIAGAYATHRFKPR